MRRLRGLDDVRPRDLVVPALLVRVEGCPDETDQQDDSREDEPDIADQRLAEAQVRAIGANNTDVEQLATKGLAGPGTTVGPEIDVIDQSKEDLKATTAIRIEIQDGTNYGGDDADDDPVDEDGHESNPKTRFRRGRN